MNELWKLTLLLSLVFIAGCAHTQNFKQANAVLTPNTSGEIDTYEQGEAIEADYTLIGTLWLGESGFSESCGYEDALYLARKKARELGADAIQVDEVKRPDFMSTCYRVGVNIIEYND